MSSDDDRARLVARAWELAEQGYGVRYIGEAIGRSTATAARYVTEGREAATWIEALNRAEERQRAALRLEMYTTWLLAERQEVGGSALEYVPVLLKIEERRARLTGSDAPTRVAVSDGRAPVSVDPATVAAVREVTEAGERELRGLVSGAVDGEDPTPT